MDFDHPKLSGKKTVQNAIIEVAAMMGENIKLRRVFAMPAPSSGVISTYLHTSPQPGTVILKFSPFSIEADLRILRIACIRCIIF